MRHLIKGIALSLAITGCVTGGDTPTASRKVIDRTPGVDDAPSWIKSSNRFSVDDDQVGFKGFLTMEADSRPDACTHAAGTEAKGRIASLIASTITDESGIAGDDKSLVANRLTAALGKQKIPGIEIRDEYWNLVEIDDGGKATRRLECWAKVTVHKKVLDKALDLAMAELFQDGRLKKHEKRLEDVQEKMRSDESK